LPEERRVVVTGVGMVSPLGLDAETTWKGLLAGQSGVGPITLFDASLHAARIAAEVKGFDPLNWVEKKDVKKQDRFIQFAIAAADMAVKDARLAIDASSAEMTGVYLGSGIGGFATIEREHEALLKGGPRRVSPFFIPSAIANLASGWVSIRTGAKGPNSCTATACTSGAHAIGDSFRLIQRGDADAMIAGGSEAAITPLAVGGFAAMRALSTRNDAPEKASRPFDKDRDGFVIGEGSGVVILEELERARGRGARIYCEIIGYGMSGDAYHITAPCEDGDGAMRVMRHAQGRPAATFGWLRQLHGTSTPRGDEVECSPQGRLRRARGSGLGDEVDDRAPPGCLGRARGRHHRARAARPDPPPDRQPRQPRPRVRPRLCAQPGAQGRGPVRHQQLLRLRRHQRRAPVQALRGLRREKP
jgi:3-oxoacyl-[acyl-carrier-protein] synthase II